MDKHKDNGVLLGNSNLLKYSPEVICVGDVINKELFSSVYKDIAEAFGVDIAIQFYQMYKGMQISFTTMLFSIKEENVKMENKEKIYEKMAVFPKKLFGKDLYKIVLLSGKMQDITRIPKGKTFLYTMKIFVDLPMNEVEKYTDSVKNYYKDKTENTAFKIDAVLISYPHFKMRNPNGIITIGADVIYDSEPPRPRRFNSPLYVMPKRIKQV